MLLQHGTPNAVAVLGAGVMGLTAATLLVERNIPVTVYAEKFTPCTTSDVAGGQWAPSFVNYEKNDSAKRQAYFDVLRRARKAHESRGPGYGVWQRWNYTINEIQHLKELRASRQRLVTAQDDERRRLERNLHDGAQQHLVALKVKLGLAEMMVDRDAAKARVVLQQLKDDADEALQTLRDLARGIYPPILADQGLVTALQAQARKATLPVDVEAGALNRHQQAQEAAVYFCVIEALQNVQKYACASHATVRLTEDASELRFEVEDDGRGFDVATVRRGTGLTNLADRLDALGGRLHIDSRVGDGCRLRGSLPLRAPAPDLVEGAGQQKGRTSRPELNAVAIN